MNIQKGIKSWFLFQHYLLLRLIISPKMYLHFQQLPFHTFSSYLSQLNCKTLRQWYQNKAAAWGTEYNE